MPWVIDGSNLARGGARETVRRAALGLARAERVSIVVFFDGAPPAGGGDLERLGRVEVRYAPHADTAILAFLAGRGRGWRLATDDRALATRAGHGGAEAVAAEAFWRRVAAAGGRTDEREAVAGAGGAIERLPDEPVRVPRRRKGTGTGVRGLGSGKRKE
jgi:hypothetical protein